MYSVLPGIALPTKDTDFLWRYISFEKFVSLLETKKLFFTRADKFDDPFEGFTPPLVKKDYARTVGDTNTLEEFQKNWSRYALCSCWHNAKEESMSMWDKYHLHNGGIAIKTTFGNFKDCLGEGYRVFIGNIEYIDHYEYPVPKNINEMSMLYTWYFYKRKPFEYEREFRAIFFDSPRSFTDYIDNYGNLINPDATLKNNKYPDTCKTGKLLKVDLNTLICKVIISPYMRKEE
ncbi:hypothetical protein C6496_13495 [Candidatus Poribacteria bacterium]|nr:MAG: hypothetical protein C6496_13495 [Candidatus Poribacteria bacterium]